MGVQHTCRQCLVRITNPKVGQLDLEVLAVGQLDLEVLMDGQLASSDGSSRL